MLLLVGDAFLLRERLGALQAQAVGDPPPFGTAETLYGDRTDVEALAVALKTLPLMGKRFVVLRQPERLKEDAQKELASMLDEIPEATSFVVAAESPDMRKTLFAALRKKGDVEALGRGSKRDGSRTPKELQDLVSRLASERGVKLTREGLAAFADFVGEDTARMVQELEKLALLHGEERLGPSQVLECLGGERVAAAFALEGAVRERRMGLAIAHLRRALSQGERPEVIVGQLAGELRSLLRARALLDSGLDESSAKREFGSGRGYFVVPCARNYRQAELVGALRMLGHVDVAAKTGQGDAGAGLERLMIRLGGRR